MSKPLPISTATHWIVVADSAMATIFSADASVDVLEIVARLEHGAARLPARDLATDDRGRTQAFPGGPRSATEPRHTPHQNEVHAFAHEIARHLRKGLTDRAYEGLVLVAPPAMLGHIRLELDVRTSERVVASIAHDYVHADPADLPGLLKRRLLERPDPWSPDKSS